MNISQKTINQLPKAAEKSVKDLNSPTLYNADLQRIFDHKQKNPRSLNHKLNKNRDESLKTRNK
jgi:hypothetical protein